MAETRMGDGCDGCDGFFEVHQSSEENSEENSVSEDSQNLVEGNAENQAKECRENPSHPSHPSPASIPAIENPSPDPSRVKESPNVGSTTLTRMEARCKGEIEAVLWLESAPIKRQALVKICQQYGRSIYQNAIASLTGDQQQQIEKLRQSRRQISP
jgi:hypothetical protein